MKTYSTSTTIHASAATVWSILTDGAAYAEWNDTVAKIEGIIASGEKIKVYASFNPDQAFPVTVSAFVPHQKMVWQSGLPLGLFKGVRTFTLSDDDDGATAFHMEEVFSGLLSPLIIPSIPDLTEPFARFAECLKVKAEEAAG